MTREDNYYDELEETQHFDVADGFVTFTEHFRYLSVRISYNLRDNFDVKSYIMAANQSMGVIKQFWDNPHTNTCSTFNLFLVIPVDLLLWGCKTWLLPRVTS